MNTNVSPENLETLEHYCTALLFSMLSLQTLEKFHTVAFQKGLLEEDEAELMTTICWEIRRLMALYTKQFEQVSERCNVNEEDIIKGLTSLVAGEKKRKRRVKNG